jgi:hypothetical protein
MNHYRPWRIPEQGGSKFNRCQGVKIQPVATNFEPEAKMLSEARLSLWRAQLEFMGDKSFDAGGQSYLASIKSSSKGRIGPWSGGCGHEDGADPSSGESL